MNNCYLFVFCLLIISCNSTDIKSKNTHSAVFSKINYSKQFGILELDDSRQIFYIRQGDTLWGEQFKKNDKHPKIAVLSTVFSGFIELLDQQQLIVALDNEKYYSDTLLLEGVKRKTVIVVGEEGQLQIERLLKQKPDYLICGSYDFQKSATGKRIEMLGIKILYCDNFKEQHPLARAEWIKFFGLITGCYEKSVAIFGNVEKRYNAIAKLNQQVKQRPLVMVDAMYGDSWFVPGGNSFTAQLIKDAGGDYIFREKQPLFTYPMTLEHVLTSARNAEIWIHTNQYNSYSELKNMDERYAMFKPFINHRVFNNNKRENAAGGNDYWERGVGRPDLILSDLHMIFNRADLSVDSLVYYKKLQLP